jgi:hypothetical protein
MLNLDMIGRSVNNNADVSGIATAKGFRDRVLKHAQGLPLELHLGSAGTGPSDHAVFFEKNIPVLFFFTGLHDDYHRPSDIWQRINAPAAAAMAELARRLALDIAADPVRPAFVKPAPSGYLGIAPQEKPTPGSSGYIIGKIVPGSPADKAGLKPGERVMELNGRPVKTPGDLAMGLIEFTAGDTVRMRIAPAGDGAGEPRTVELTLAARTMPKPEAPAKQDAPPAPAAPSGK